MSCSSDSENADPILSFTIEPGNRFASSEINITNTSTNYVGTYFWEVSSEFGTENFNSQDLTFIASRATQYFIKLSTSASDFETQENLITSAPSSLTLRGITLKEVTQDYPSLYFTLTERTASNRERVVFTSEPISNIEARSPSTATWSVDVSTDLVRADLGGPSLLDDLKSYQISFYDERDNLITKLEPYNNGRAADSEYIGGEIDLELDPRDCVGCPEFVVTADFLYSN